MAARYAALQPAQCWREGQANGDDAPRGEPDKLAAEVRKSHFEEIYQPFTPQQGAAAGRPLSHVWGAQYLRMDLPAA